MAYKQDFLSAAHGGPYEHIPIYLFDVTLGMEAAGIDTDVIYSSGFNGELSARSLLALQKHLGYDAVNGSTSWFDNRVYGNEIEFPSKGIPYHKEFCLKDPSKLYDLDHSMIPDTLLEQLSLSHRLVKEGTDAALVSHVPSPLGAAAGLRGLEYMLIDMMQDPDYVRDLLTFCLGTIDIVVDRVFGDNDIDMGLISGAYDNVGIIGTDGIRDFSMPFLRKVIRIINRDDPIVCFHPHGELHLYEDMLKGYADAGVQLLYYGDSCEPLEIHRILPDMPLMGGIDTFTTITLGDRDRVRKDVSHHLDMMDGIDHIFSCSCSVDRGLSMENIEEMVHTVRERGHTSV